jgi:DNA ligase-1
MAEENCMLASKYSKKWCDLSERWYASKKIDGMRALWNANEQQFYSRNLKPIYAPEWFIAGMPDYDLDGELVFTQNGSEVGNYQLTMSVCRRHNPDDRWKNVMYYVFDAPQWPFTFEAVYDTLQRQMFPRHIKVLKQTLISDDFHLRNMHDEYVGIGGEGLIVRKGTSYYESTRSKNMLKVKIWDDSEATVIEHHPGVGKHEGRLGGLICRWSDGRNDRTFHVGVGFTDAERENPPPIGSTITFSYFGMTDGGSPRHPKYLRLRSDE